MRLDQKPTGAEVGAVVVAVVVVAVVAAAEAVTVAGEAVPAEGVEAAADDTKIKTNDLLFALPTIGQSKGKLCCEF